MQNRFHIEFRKNQEDLHISPSGEFDSGTALQLIALLRRELHKSGQVIIDTGHLRRVCPIGSCTFKSGLHDSHLPLERLSFSGDKASDIAPEESRILPLPESLPVCRCNGRCTHCACAERAGHDRAKQPAH